MKKWFCILLLICSVYTVFAQGFAKRGEVFAGASMTTPIETFEFEEIVITLGEDEYYRYMPQDIEAAQELIRNLTKAYEKVSNLSLQYSESHLKQLETLLVDAEGLDDELKPIQSSLEEYNKQITLLTRNQAKRLALGLFSQGIRGLSADQWSVTLGPLVQYNFMNSILFGVGLGVAASPTYVGGAFQLQVALWK